MCVKAPDLVVCIAVAGNGLCAILAVAHDMHGVFEDDVTGLNPVTILPFLSACNPPYPICPYRLCHISHDAWVDGNAWTVWDGICVFINCRHNQ